jgi:hypothetical protein
MHVVVVLADIVDQACVFLGKGCLADVFERLAGVRAAFEQFVALGHIGLWCLSWWNSSVSRDM